MLKTKKKTCDDKMMQQMFLYKLLFLFALAPFIRVQTEIPGCLWKPVPCTGNTWITVQAGSASRSADCPEPCSLLPFNLCVRLLSDQQRSTALIRGGIRSLPLVHVCPSRTQPFCLVLRRILSGERWQREDSTPVSASAPMSMPWDASSTW